MRDWLARAGSKMPAEELFGVVATDAGEGRVAGTQRRVPSGAPTLGWVGVLVDAMGGRPVVAASAADRRLSTVSMHLQLLRPPTPADGAALTGAGRLVALASSWAITEITVAGAGRPLVTAGTRMLIEPLDLPELPDGAGPVGAHASGAGDLPTLLGLRPATDAAAGADGAVALEFVPTPRHANPYPIVHGGVHVALVDAVLTAAVATLPDRPPLTLLGLELSYHRPMPTDGGVVRLEGAVTQPGRRAVHAEAVVLGTSGRVLTRARGVFGSF